MRLGYYKVLNLASRLSSSEESTPTPQSVSSFNVSKAEKGVSWLPTIVESLEIEVHCLSSNSDLDCEANSDSEDVVVVGSANDYTSVFVGAQDPDIQYPHFHENTDVRSDGVVKSEDESGNSFNPSQGSGSEKTVMASEWLTSQRSESTMIYTGLDPLPRYSLLGSQRSLLKGVSLYVSSVRLLHCVWSFARVECIMLCPRIL